MTVKELKEKLEQLDENLIVAICNWDGDYKEPHLSVENRSFWNYYYKESEIVNDILVDKIEANQDFLILN